MLPGWRPRQAQPYMLAWPGAHTARAAPVCTYASLRPSAHYARYASHVVYLDTRPTGHASNKATTAVRSHDSTCFEGWASKHRTKTALQAQQHTCAHFGAVCTHTHTRTRPHTHGHSPLSLSLSLSLRLTLIDQPKNVHQQWKHSVCLHLHVIYHGSAHTRMCMHPPTHLHIKVGTHARTHVHTCTPTYHPRAHIHPSQTTYLVFQV